ncbi:hypothetical protein [Streptomyces sp. NPDC018000]|uniref:hypothetical protein n=1 Tax=Streptomyces sp. NPDC018000 TaxID=3365028 RepID=UPI0037AD907D
MYDRSVTRLAARAADTATGPEPPAAPVSEAERDALRLWRRMALEATTDGAQQPQRISVPVELRAALRLFEAATKGPVKGSPSAPSAGALYPYEHFVVTGDPQGPAVFAVDVARRSCRLLHRGEQVAQVLEHSGFASTHSDPTALDAFLVLTVVRPWLSMRKYGDRGYLYAQMDAAHLGVHLLCLGSRSHRRAQWLTQAATGPLTALLGLSDNCRFLHSVLLLDDPVHGCTRTPPQGTWSCTDARGGAPQPLPTDLPEAQYWRRLAAYRPDPPEHSAAPRRGPLLTGAPATGQGGSAAAGTDLAGLTARRRSAKDFAAEVLPADAVRDALAAMVTPLTTDLSVGDGFGATLVVRRVAGLAPGAYRVRAGGIAPEPSGTTVAADDEIVRICMGQEHLRHTAAAVVFHARRQEIFPLGMTGIDQALARAAALAHLLCLGATGAGAAVTTIGGFDTVRWHALAAVPEEEEVLYVAMLGTAGTSAVKLDRLQRAYAHDER